MEEEIMTLRERKGHMGGGEGGSWRGKWRCERDVNTVLKHEIMKR